MFCFSTPEKNYPKIKGTVRQKIIWSKQNQISKENFLEWKNNRNLLQEYVKRVTKEMLIKIVGVGIIPSDQSQMLIDWY